MAKNDFYAAVMTEAEEAGVVASLKWVHPPAMKALLDCIAALGWVARGEVAMEPSGTSGDALCWRFVRAGVEA